MIQILTPHDLETLVQRLGRAGRDPELDGDAEAIVMAQDSVFEDSKAGQKRAVKLIKQEEEPHSDSELKSIKKQAQVVAEKLVRQAAKEKDDKARRVPKEYAPEVVEFVPTKECRVEILDRKFDNPHRPEGQVCRCDNCRHERGELTFREIMAAE